MGLRSASSNHRPLTVWLLVGSLAVLALGGLSGAWMFLSDPSGASIGMADVLRKLPVNSFLLPGLFLLFFMCLLPLFLIYALIALPWSRSRLRFGWSKVHWSWVATFALGIGLIAWLFLQAVYIGFSAPAQYFTAGLAVVILTLLLAPTTRKALRWSRASSSESKACGHRAHVGLEAAMPQSVRFVQTRGIAVALSNML